MKTFRFNHYGKAGPDELFYITTPAESDVYVLASEANERIAYLEKAYRELHRDTTAMMGEDARRIKVLEATLESIRVYLMCGAWIFNKSPDEFIKQALEVK